MKSKWVSLVIMFSVAVGCGTSAFAKFEQLFQVTEINGKCNLKRPKEKKFSPAVQNKAYPFGTKITTDSDSSLVISFSAGNTCRILPMSSATVDQSATDDKQKIVRLGNGEVELHLKENFHKGGYGLSVQTATAVFDAIGCEFRVASKLTEENLRVIIARVLDGSIKVYGDNFSASQLDKDDWVSLLSPADRSFLRLKTVKGKFDVTIKDENHEDKQIPTEEGTVLKIWQREVPGTGQHVVTIVLTSPKGELVETYTVTYEKDDKSGYNPESSSGKDDLAELLGEEGSEDNGSGEKASGDNDKEKGERGNPVYNPNPGFKEPDPDTPKDPTPTGKR